MNTRTCKTLPTLFATILLCGAAEAGASDWKWSITPYAWATDVGADVSVDDRQVIDEEIAFTDLLEDIETVSQVRIEAQRGAHGVMFDLFDVVLADEGTVSLPKAGITDAAVSSEIGMTIIEAGGIYDPNGDQKGFALFYGTRILDERAEIDFTSDKTGSETYEAGETLVDGLIGFRYVKRFSPRWSYQLRVDASAGGTELTWSAGSETAYAFGKGGRYAFTAGYRHMEVDFKSDELIDADMTLSGFVAGLRATF